MDKQFFDSIFEEIKADTFKLFNEQFKDAGKEAFNDVSSFIEQSKDKLQEWTAQLLTGDIDGELFKQFVSNQQALLQMKVLTQKGLTQIKIDSFQNGLKDLVINKILTKFLPAL